MHKPVIKLIKYERVQIHLQGAVQGVGFRPFVYRLGVELNLSGHVINSSSGVTIEAEGPLESVQDFLKRLTAECPPHAVIDDIHTTRMPLQKEDRFIIKDSQMLFRPNAVIVPDMGTCPQCLFEIFDSNNRRYLYPFTNCTHCGPRYSIIENLPYDRHNTSMRGFLMCSDCQSEFDDPNNRRFHAQPNACPSCGPQVQLLNGFGSVIEVRHQAIQQSVQQLRDGKIIALKGIGGFQLLVDGLDEKAVKRLRERKHRLEKPFAMMFPSLNMIKDFCEVSACEERALRSIQSPIVLLRKKDRTELSPSVATNVSTDNAYLGIMLPYSPLHHLLMKEFEGPLVMTSGNISDEPMCISTEEALNRLGAIADYFLVHDRPIVRPVDDSLGMVIKERFSLLRRARGYAPLPVLVKNHACNVLALGAHLKNTVALKISNKVYLSQHIGDLDSQESMATFGKSVNDLRALYTHPVDYIAVDMHPDYASTRYALRCKEPIVSIQHHHAHVVACMAENHLNGPVLGIAWDGTGLGDNNTIWGSEFLVSTESEYERAGYLMPFRLPGGDAATLSPIRTALGLMYILGDGDLSSYHDLSCFQKISQKDQDNIHTMLSKGFQSPLTSSMGRLFDGVSAILGLCDHVSYEGQAALLLENSIGGVVENSHYSFVLGEGNMIDWRPMLTEIISDIRTMKPQNIVSAKFHNSLVAMAVKVAQQVRQHQVVLSGGCFQNRYLLTRLIDRLRGEGFDPYWHTHVPTNDGGIALGQAVIAAARWNKNRG